MATPAKLRLEIKKLKAAIKSKATPKTIVTKLKSQLEHKEVELEIVTKKVTKKAATASVTKSKTFAVAKKYRLKQAGVSASKSDIEKDAVRPAKPIGVRVTDGKHYPYVKGSKYYEYRENRTDRKQPPKKYPKLEDGGMMAKGGKIDYSKQTSDDFQLGEIVWDTDNKRYGTIIGIYDGYLSDKYEVRLDTDGMQPTENLRKVGSEGDEGTKEQLKEEVELYARLIKSYPKNNYPKQIEPMKMAEGGSLEEQNNEMLQSRIKMIKHHADELHETVTDKTHVDAWVVAKIERAASDLSDVAHYLDGLKMAHGGKVHIHTHEHEHRIKH